MAIIVRDLWTIPDWYTGPDMNAKAWSWRSHRWRHTDPDYIKWVVSVRRFDKARIAGPVRMIAPRWRQTGPKVFR